MHNQTYHLVEPVTTEQNIKRWDKVNLDLQSDCNEIMYGQT